MALDYKSLIREMGSEEFKALHMNEWAEPEDKKYIVLAKYRGEFERWAASRGFDRVDETMRRIIHTSDGKKLLGLRPDTRYYLVWIPWLPQGRAEEDKFLSIARMALATGLQFEPPEQREEMHRRIQEITMERISSNIQVDKDMHK